MEEGSQNKMVLGSQNKMYIQNKIRFPSTYDGEFIKINSLVEGAHEIKTHVGGMSELVNIKCMYFMDGSEQKNVGEFISQYGGGFSQNRGYALIDNTAVVN